MNSRADYFLQLNIARARGRKHRPCPIHKTIRRVCETCAKMFCPKCNNHPCLTPVKVTSAPPTEVYTPPPRWRALWKVVKPLGAFRLEDHPDADAIKICFPPHTLNTSAAGELADRIFDNASITALGESTPFRAGRGSKPSHWWVSIRLKEKTK